MSSIFSTVDYMPHSTLPRHCTWRPTPRHVIVYDLALRRLCSCRRPDDPVSAIGHFLWPQRDYWTLSRSPCEQFHLT